MLTLWFVTTGIIVVTPKYQIELQGELGRVYTNYAPGWLALATILILLSSRLDLRKVSLRLVLSILLVGVGLLQTFTNSRQLALVESSFVWAEEFIDAVDNSNISNEERCNYWSTVSTLPLPEYYIQAISDGVSNAYKGTHGRPYCE
jgi:hypothetical protein